MPSMIVTKIWSSSSKLTDHRPIKSEKKRRGEIGVSVIPFRSVSLFSVTLQYGYTSRPSWCNTDLVSQQKHISMAVRILQATETHSVAQHTSTLLACSSRRLTTN